MNLALFFNMMCILNRDGGWGVMGEYAVRYDSRAMASSVPFTSMCMFSNHVQEFAVLAKNVWIDTIGVHEDFKFRKLLALHRCQPCCESMATINQPNSEKGRGVQIVRMSSLSSHLVKTWDSQIKLQNSRSTVHSVHRCCRQDTMHIWFVSRLSYPSVRSLSVVMSLSNRRCFGCSTLEVRRSTYKPSLTPYLHSAQYVSFVFNRIYICYCPGFAVRVLVRNLYSSTLDLLGTGATFAQGDLTNYRSIVDAVSGVDKVMP